MPPFVFTKKTNIYTCMFIYADIFMDYPWKDVEECYKLWVPLLAESMGRLNPSDYPLQKASGLERILSIRLRGADSIQTVSTVSHQRHY